MNAEHPVVPVFSSLGLTEDLVNLTRNRVYAVAKRGGTMQVLNLAQVKARRRRREQPESRSPSSLSRNGDEG